MHEFEQVGPVLARLADAVESMKAVGAEGLNAEQAAAFVGVSRSKWHELHARGLCPTAVELGDGRCPRWCRTELRAWLLAGAPPRSRWVLMKDSALRKAG